MKPEDRLGQAALIDAPGVVVMDTRNDYEVGIGTFDRAINPHTRRLNFRRGWQNNRSSVGCWLATPRWRCFVQVAFAAKNPAFLKSWVLRMYHLEGGILKYLETVPGGVSRVR